MADQILPRACDILTPGLDAIIALRPEARAHFNNPNSNWSKLPAMWRAQIQRLIARLSDEVLAARLRFSTGDALRTLSASEFNTTLVSDPQTAIGRVQLDRNTIGGPAGSIKAGQIFNKPAFPNGISAADAITTGFNAYPVAIPSASYRVTSTVYVPAGPIPFDVQLEAVSPGVAGNIPQFGGVTPFTAFTPVGPLFDPTTVVVSAIASGGSSCITDAVLVAAAKPTAVRPFGPTDGAIIAGLLTQQSVRHLAAFRANGNVPYAQIYCADESWGTGPQDWGAQLLQVLADEWVGFGCRVRMGSVANIKIAVAATIALAATDDLNDTSEIDANVRAVAESYFNDRPDWYLFRLSTLQDVLSKADPRILHCSTVIVTDATTGVPIAEPLNTFGQAWAPYVVHYYLTDSEVTATYTPPD